MNYNFDFRFVSNTSRIGNVVETHYNPLNETFLLDVDIVLIDRSNPNNPTIAVHDHIDELSQDRDIEFVVVGNLQSNFIPSKSHFLTLIENGKEIRYKYLIECLPHNISYEDTAKGKVIRVNREAVKKAMHTHDFVKASKLSSNKPRKKETFCHVVTREEGTEVRNFASTQQATGYSPNSFSFHYQF